MTLAAAAAAAWAGGGWSARKAGRAEGGEEAVEGEGGEGQGERRRRRRQPRSRIAFFILFACGDGSAASRPTVRMLGDAWAGLISVKN